MINNLCVSINRNIIYSNGAAQELRIINLITKKKGRKKPGREDEIKEHQGNG